MNNDELRQLVKIRHELRRLLPMQEAPTEVAGPCNRDTARQLLSRMRDLTAPHVTERARIESEMIRWQSVFQL